MSSFFLERRSYKISRNVEDFLKLKFLVFKEGVQFNVEDVLVEIEDLQFYFKGVLLDVRLI